MANFEAYKEINGVKMDIENPITQEFSNWKEVSDWWSANPSAVRVEPNIQTQNIEEYNQINHELSFPCEMTFIKPAA